MPASASSTSPSLPPAHLKPINWIGEVHENPGTTVWVVVVLAMVAGIYQSLSSLLTARQRRAGIILTAEENRKTEKLQSRNRQAELTLQSRLKKEELSLAAVPPRQHPSTSAQQAHDTEDSPVRSTHTSENPDFTSSARPPVGENERQEQGDGQAVDAGNAADGNARNDDARHVKRRSLGWKSVRGFSLKPTKRPSVRKLFVYREKRQANSGSG